MAATSLQDDGRAAGAIPITIEATQTGSTASNVTIDNQGNFKLSQWSGSVYTTIFQVLAGAASGADNVKLSDSNHQAHVLGTFLVDLAATFSGTLTMGTQLILPTGSLTRIAQFGPYNITNTSAFYTHNLGVIPDMVLLTVDKDSGANPPTANFSTMTTTQVALVSSLTTATVTRGIAIKF